MAAGHSTRFGGDKVFVKLGSRALASFPIQAVQHVDLPFGVVIRPDHRAAWASLANKGTLLLNNRAETGLGSSIRIGAQWAYKIGAASVVFLLADMPLVSPQTIAKLATTGSTGQRAGTKYPDACGVPAVFPRSDFCRLLSNGNHTATRVLLQEPSTRTIRIPEIELLDVDTPACLSRIESRLDKSANQGPVYNDL